MSEVLQQIGSFLTSPGGKVAETGAVAGTGFLQNWLANRQAAKKQKFVEDLITNPAKMQAFVSNFEKPLAAGLTNDVSRSADAYGAERGLGSSPAVMKDVYAQALAPFIMQQKDAATSAALQSLGIYESSPTQKPMDVTSLLKMLMTGGTAPAGVTGTDPSSVPASGGQGLFDMVGAPAIATQLPQPTIGDTTDSGSPY